MTAVQVGPVPASDRNHVLAVMTVAFSSDPTMRWMYPDAQAYVEHFPGFANAFGGGAFDHGTALVAEGFGGACLWFPPGTGPDVSALGDHMVRTIPEAELAGIVSLFEQMEGYRPDEDHWYLPMIGVDASRQGQGIGSALMRAALETVDEAGLPAYLESSNPANITLYQRHGFEAMGEIRGSEGAPVLTPMYRSERYK